MRSSGLVRVIRCWVGFNDGDVLAGMQGGSVMAAAFVDWKWHSFVLIF